MKLNENFTLHQVADTWVVVPLNQETVDFSGMLMLNDSGVMLWKALEQGADPQTLTDVLTGEYDVTREQARKDVDEFLDTLRKTGCLMEA